jgi:hypothetical protein
VLQPVLLVRGDVQGGEERDERDGRQHEENEQRHGPWPMTGGVARPHHCCTAARMRLPWPTDRKRLGREGGPDATNPFDVRTALQATAEANLTHIGLEMARVQDLRLSTVTINWSAEADQAEISLPEGFAREQPEGRARQHKRPVRNP